MKNFLMIKGITDKEYKIIKDILKNYDAKFFAYGSRVKGDFSELSDLDILVKSEKNIKLMSSAFLPARKKHRLFCV